LGGVRIAGDSQDFAETNNCPATLPAKSSCTFNVTFTPTKKGARDAELQFSGGGGGVKNVTLSGNGE